MLKIFCSLNILIIMIIFLSVSPMITIAEEIDSDGDGWTDSYEEKLGTDPNNIESVPEDSNDTDRDGLIDRMEMELGTDPLDPDTDNDKLSDYQEVKSSLSNPLNSDTDRDGLTDFTEILKGTNPMISDTDGDGWLDSAEIEAGSNPCDTTSKPETPYFNL